MKYEFKKKIYESKDLNGLTGDNGENFVVFFSAWGNPLNSVWAWFSTKEEAEKAEIKENN